MSVPPAQIAQLKEFVKVLKQDPNLLHDDKLAFFRDYLTSLGATIPEKKKEEPKVPEPEPEDEELPELEEQEEEAEIEEPVDPNVIPPETDAPQPLGDLNTEPSDEGREKAQELRGRAQELIGSGEAIKVLTDAITNHNGSSAPLYATRGQCYLRLKKPASAIRDADAAIKINPDSAPAYRVRGKAKALLGQWTGAASDLKAANQRDYDPDVNEVLKGINVKVDEFNARQKQRDEQKRRRESKNKPAGGQAPKFSFPGGGAPGAGGLGGIPPELLNAIMQDPEVLSAMSDPEVMPILTELMSNPTAALKYKDHPKIGKLISKFATMFGK